MPVKDKTRMREISRAHYARNKPLVMRKVKERAKKAREDASRLLEGGCSICDKPARILASPTDAKAPTLNRLLCDARSPQYIMESVTDYKRFCKGCYQSFLYVTKNGVRPQKEAKERVRKPRVPKEKKPAQVPKVSKERKIKAVSVKKVAIRPCSVCGETDMRCLPVPAKGHKSYCLGHIALRDKKGSLAKAISKYNQPGAFADLKMRYNAVKNVVFMMQSKLQTRRCKRCGFEGADVLTYVHREGEEVRFDVNVMETTVMSRDEYDAEIRKCDLLCPNCIAKKVPNAAMSEV